MKFVVRVLYEPFVYWLAPSKCSFCGHAAIGNWVRDPAAATKYATPYEAAQGMVDVQVLCQFAIVRYQGEDQ